MPQSKIHLNSNRSNEISIEDGNVNYFKTKDGQEKAGNPGEEPHQQKLISLHSPTSLSSSDSLHSVASSPKHPQRTEAQEQDQDIMRASQAAFNLSLRRQTQDQQ